MTRIRMLLYHALLASIVSLAGGGFASAQIYLPGAEPYIPPKDSTLTIRVSRLAPGVFAAKVNFVWTGWVELPDGILVIDSGMADSAGTALADTIRARSKGRPFKYLGLTSDHEDHVLGAKAFLAAGATLVAQEKVIAGIRAALGTAEDASKEIRIQDRKRFGTVARPVDVVWLGRSAASHGDLVVHLPKQRVLFSGDLVSNKSIPWLLDPAFNLEGYRAALDSLNTKTFAANVLVPGHGAIAKPQDGLKFMRSYLRDADDKASKMAGWGQAASEVRKWGYLGPYEGMEFYHEVHYMNMKRLLAEAKGVKTPGRGRVRALRQ